MPDGIRLLRDSHTTWLKWHRARKTAADLPFTGERILEGLKLGASVEVDLVRHGGGGFAVLHDFLLDRDTTGHGRVADTSPELLRTLFLRGRDGRPTAHRPMLFEHLCALIAAGQDISPAAVLQLDLKEDASALTPEAQLLVLPPGRSPSPTIPSMRVHRNASPPVAADPTPTTTDPSALTPSA